MQILLHIGMHKTGSTAIQKAMRSYDDGETVYARLARPNHSLAFQAAFSRNYQSYYLFERENISPEARSRIHRESRAQIIGFLEKTRARRVIFSGEDICNLDPDSLRDMQQTLARYSDDIQAMAYVRPPVVHARSNVQEVIRTGGTFIGRAMHPRYRPHLEKFLLLFGEENVDVRLFDRGSLTGGDVICDFAENLGLDRRRMRRAEANKSISLEAQKCLYLLNCAAKPSFGGPRLTAARHRLVRLLDRVVPKGGEMPGAVFAPHFDRADIAWMAQRLGVSFDLPRFSETSTPLAVAYASPSDETVETLVEALHHNGIRPVAKRDPTALVCQLFDLCDRQMALPSLRRTSPGYLLDHPVVREMKLRFAPAGRDG